MSRSNPTANQNPNPAERFYEWRGGTGNFAFWDRDKKVRVEVPLPFTFLVLDQLCTVKGYNETKQSGIYSNEIRDTRAEPLVVKFFKGGTIAEGFWTGIKDKVVAADGHFCTNCYIAYRQGGDLKLGAIQFQGSSLGPWFDFVKENRKALDTQAVIVKSCKDEKVGAVKFKSPIFSLLEIKPETNVEANTLDAKLQEYLKGYFSRSRLEQAATPAPVAAEPVSKIDPRDVPGYHEPEPTKLIDDSDVPF